MIDITQIVVAAIALAGTILTTVITLMVVPWLKSKISTQRYDQLMSIVSVAVQAAEQMYKGDDMGGSKLTYALKRVNETLAEHGIIYNENTVRAAIEAAVLQLHA